jgi:GT2 family glycosyltransferase
MRKIDLSIIIVNFNTQDLLAKLLESIKNSTLGSLNLETIVIDNNSLDSSVEMIQKYFPKVILLKNKINLGFAKANNIGIRRARGRYTLLLNSDTLLEKNTLRLMMEFMDEHKEFAAATCRVELPNKRIDPACHRGFPTPWAAFTYFIGLESFFPQSRTFGQYHQTWENLNVIHSVDVISGAFFMIKTEVISKIGLLDERFFVYAEDIDLCLRLKEGGYKIAFVPNTKIIHFKRSSGRNKLKGIKITQEAKLAKENAKKNFYETMRLFYDKHYRNKYPWILRVLVLLGIKIMSKIKD